MNSTLIDANFEKRKFSRPQKDLGVLRLGEVL